MNRLQEIIDNFLNNKQYIKPKLDRKPILLLDQDDILFEYVEEVLIQYNEKYTTNFTLNDITEWNLTATLGKKVKPIMSNPKIFRHLSLVKHCKEVLKFLIDCELVEVYIVSAAFPTCCNSKYESIKEYLPFIDLTHIIFTPCKYLVQGDVLFDDAPHNVQLFKNGIPVLRDRPYNKNITDIKRVHDWIEFLEFILDEFYPTKK